MHVCVYIICAMCLCRVFIYQISLTVTGHSKTVIVNICLRLNLELRCWKANVFIFTTHLSNLQFQEYKWFTSKLNT